MPIERLPEGVKPMAECVRRAMMSDAGVMIILGVSMIFRGLSYFDLGSVVLFHPVDLFFPLWVDSLLWAGGGVLLLVASLWHTSAFGRAALAFATGLMALWGLLFLFSPPAQFSQRGVMYLALAAVVIWAVWRGRRGEIRVRKGAPRGGDCSGR